MTIYGCLLNTVAWLQSDPSLLSGMTAFPSALHLLQRGCRQSLFKLLPYGLLQSVSLHRLAQVAIHARCQTPLAVALKC